MREVGELAGVAQEDVRQDLQAMFRGAIRASGDMSTCRYSRTKRWIKQRDERAEELAQILLHTTRDLTLIRPQ